MNAAITTVELKVSITGSGTGSVTIYYWGTSKTCTSGTCYAAVPYNQVATVTATPTNGSQFAGWLGACSGTGSCSLTMTGSKSVSATFATSGNEPLVVSTVGYGAVTSSPAGINCGSACEADYALGTTVTLTATPAAGQTFNGWSSSSCGTSPTCAVTMSGPQSATALFSGVKLKLDATLSGSAHGVVSSAPAGIFCGGTNPDGGSTSCGANYDPGTIVVLTASPTPLSDGGPTAAIWHNDCDGVPGTAQCSVKMDQARSVWVEFDMPASAPGLTSAAKSTFGASPSTLSVSAPTTINITLRDAYGQPVVGRAVALSVSPSTGATLSAPPVTDANGFTSSTLSASATGAYTVTANVDAQTFTTAVTFTAACAIGADCPGADTDCKVRSCAAGVCGFAFVAAGTQTASQTAGDCKVNQCDGAGNVVSVNDDADVPVDANACTADVCSSGVPSNPALTAGTACSQGGGSMCNGAGACVQCLAASNCPGSDTECETRVCNFGICGMTYAPSGTRTSAQTAGDCQVNECDGTGAIVSAADDTDLPVDANPCTNDLCTGGTPSNPAATAGTVCNQNGGTMCDGSGNCVQCLAAATCPGSDSECQLRTCIAGACGVAFAPAGTLVSSQTSGDCKDNVCDGSGSVTSIADNADLPVDNNQCTADLCTAGSPSNPPVSSGVSCNQNGGSVCNGTGQCVQCLAAADCPGSDTECQTRTCTSGVCGMSYASAGTRTSAQTAGDCQVNQCDGSGHIVSVADNTDLPVDGNTCTSDVCTSGVPSNPPVASGTACSQNGGIKCNGSGQCVQCLAAADCAGTDTDCESRTCTSGVCGMSYVSAGTPTSSQLQGDCKVNQCNGSGQIVAVADNTDVPIDNNQCTGDVCTSGTPSNPNLAAGTACDQSGGTVCNGSGTCADCVPGATQCATNSVETCDETGHWGAPVACANTCVNGACGGACVPGAVECSGTQPQLCNSSGAWVSNGPACTQPTPICSSGACTCPTQTCSGLCVDESTDPSNCGSCGKTCAAGETCSSGACVCDPTASPDPATGVFVATTGSDTTGNGSAASPYQTLAKGVATANGAGRPNVYVAPGTYSESPSLVDAASGTSIQGGWVVSGGSWTRDCSAGARASTVIQGAAVAVRATNVTHLSGLAHLTVKTQASASAAAADTSGTSLIGVFVTGASSSFFLDDVAVFAGNAGAGGAASAGSTSTACLSGGLTCSTGANGSPGGAGGAASVAGSFGLAGFTPSNGNAGIAGGNGQPGAAGGNGSCTTYSPSCSVGTVCSKSPPACTMGTNTQVCGLQGTCGCGGGGGGGGNAGRGGGASAAVLVAGSGASVAITASSLNSGNGGAATAGGSAGGGHAGANGAPGANQTATGWSCTNTGCGGSKTQNSCSSATVTGPGGATGGLGGNGAAGGAGGGGAGGSSYALVTASGASATTDGSTTLAFGSAGAGASGGVNGAAAQRLSAP